MLYCWGRNSDGQCGDNRTTQSKQHAALPHPVSLPKAVMRVACGTGQQGCTFAILVDGSLWSFGNDSGCRLGHPKETSEHWRAAAPISMPRKVEALDGLQVINVSCADCHALC